MKALVYTGPEKLEYRDTPDPEPNSDEVLVRIEAVGICGSDMHAYFGHDERRPPPIILGHEAAGVILTGPDKNKRVVVNPLAVCGKCPACSNGRSNLCAHREIISMPPRQGAFAEKLAIPRKNLIEIPVGFDVETASLVEPFSCGWHAVRIASQVLDKPIEDSVCLVIGGGAIGVGAAFALFAKKAKRISLTEPNSLRFENLSRFNQFTAVESDSLSDSGGNLIDLVIDSVGLDKTREVACKTVRPGGVIANIGLGQGNSGLDIRRMTLQEITYFGTYTYTKEDFSSTANAIFSGEFGNIDIYESHPLSEGAYAFEEISNGRIATSKIILIPQNLE